MPFFNQQQPYLPSNRLAKSAIGTEAQRNQLAFMAGMFISMRNAYAEPLRLTKENYDYAEGNSWEEKLKNNLLKRGIPPLEINIILPRILAVLGQYFESRGRLVAIPTQNAGVNTAEVGTRLLEWQNEQSIGIINARRDDEIMKALTDALIGEMGGWLEIYWDNWKDPLGFPCVRRVSPFYMLPDPAVDIALAAIDGRVMLKSMFRPVEWILANYPKYRQEIQSITGQYTRTNWWQSVTNMWSRITGAGEDYRNEFVHQRENTFRLIEMHERRIEKQAFIFNPYDGQLSGPMPTAEAMQHVSGNVDLNIWERDTEIIWTSISLGDWLLLDEYPRDIQNKVFPIIPLPGYSLGSGKNISPVVGQLKGLQREKNQARTSFLTILRSNAFGGWIYSDQSLSEEMEEKLEKLGASAGFNMKYKFGFDRPERIMYQSISTGDIQRDQMTMQDAENVSALGRGEIGLQESGGESGILHRQKVIQAVKTLRLIFNNTEICEVNIAHYLLDMMQFYLQPGRALLLTGKEGKVEELVVDDQLRLAQWMIKVIKGADSETQRAEKLLEIREFMSIVMAVAPDRGIGLLPLILDALNWNDKERFMQALQLDNQIPLAFQAKLLKVLQNTDEGMTPGMQEGEQTPLQLGAGTQVSPEMAQQIGTA